MPEGRFTAERMHGVLRSIAEHLGFDCADATALHMANNAVYALPAAGVVLRITRSNQLHDRIRKGVRLGHWFAQVDAPTIRLRSSIDQPVKFEDLLATVWDFVPPSSPKPDAGDLGRVLREFHNLPAPTVELPTWDPVGTARRRIADAEYLDPTDRAALLDWCDRLEPRVDTLVAASTGALIHGDAHAGNLLRAPNGRILLCDFDSTCLGPSTVDLAAVAAAEIWFESTGEHDRLAASYGYDITTDPAWPILCEARELTFVVGGVPLMASTPGVAHEFRRRLDSVLAQDHSVTWRPYADYAKTG